MGAGLQEARKKKSGGNNENPVGGAEISGPSDENHSLKAAKYKVQNFRANHLTGNKNSTVFSLTVQ